MAGSFACLCASMEQTGSFNCSEAHSPTVLSLEQRELKSSGFPSVTVQKYTMQVNHRLIYFALLDGGVN